MWTRASPIHHLNLLLHSTEWPKLRNIIKSKLTQVISRLFFVFFTSFVLQNIDFYLSECRPPPTPVSSPPLTLSNGGLKLPPFGPRQQSGLGMDVPPSYMNREQAEEMKQFIFAELDGFDEYVTTCYIRASHNTHSANLHSLFNDSASSASSQEHITAL